MITQVIRNIFNFGENAQCPSTTWFTCSLRVRGTFLSSYVQYVATRSA